MDKIYAGADLTIIAAADTKAPYGLPGVSTDRRQPDIFAVGQSNFFSIRDPTHELQSSVWATRGWTYQEMVLSRRRLAFTDTQVYFQCKSMYRFELPDATWSPSPKLRSDGWLGSRYNAFPMDGPGQTASINLIYERIQGYYGRQLSYDSDILNAFSGVFSAYTAGTLESANDSNNGGVMTHFFGIPVVSVRDSSTGITRASLSAGLAWTVAWDKHSPKRPEKPSERTRVPHQASGWPSWSWTSFKRGRLAFSPNAPITPDTGNLLPVVLTHRNGTTVDLAQFASSKADYADFEPWIDVTSWVSKISEPQPDERALRRHLDPLLENRVPKTLTAMFLRLHEFAETAMEYGGYTMTVLLLEEVEDGVFRRVGIVEGSRSYPSAACSRLFASDVIIAPNPILHFPRGPGENPLDGWGEPMVVEKLEKKKIRLI